VIERNDAATERRLREIAAAATHSRGVELVELLYLRPGRRQVVRLIVDKVGGVTIDECADLSRRMSADLDMVDVLAGRYTLEVSSPGLDRPLKTAADFRRKFGRAVSVRYKAAPDQTEIVEGEIGEVNEDSVMIGERELRFVKIIEGKLIV
jgi:ribosome maturation factor RimP